LYLVSNDTGNDLYIILLNFLIILPLIVYCLEVGYRIWRNKKNKKIEMQMADEMEMEGRRKAITKRPTNHKIVPQTPPSPRSAAGSLDSVVELIEMELTKTNETS